MYTLTNRIKVLADKLEHKPLLDALWTELPEGAHIEHLLSHLGDYAALAMRSKSQVVKIGTVATDHKKLTSAHEAILKCIAEIIRWGYVSKNGVMEEQIGTPQNALTRIDEHKAFIDALFSTAQAGLQERRRPVRLFTTNYDTLIEDAVALAQIPYWDGFCGGAIAFRTHRFGQEEPKTGARAYIIKLHGSIDWYLGEDGKVWRVRDLDPYPPKKGLILIHPQATKYVATQRDPFAAQFDLFRRALSSSDDNVLAVCGYSFGDDHINQEIEICLEKAESRTTLIAFCMEGNAMPECLKKWRDSAWGQRVYVLTEKGLYVGSEGPLYALSDDRSHEWWTFSGATNLLRNGAASGL